MKKKLRFGLMATALLGIAMCGSLGLAACGNSSAPAAHVHRYGAWVTVEEADCTTDGLQRRTCTDEDCDVEEGRVQEQVIPALGHDWGIWKIDVPAKCTEGGKRSHICNVCQEAETEDTDPLGHSWDAGVFLDGQEATCTSKGRAIFTCEECNETEEREVDMLPHTWGFIERTKNPDCTHPGEETHRCSVCGFTETVEVPALEHSWNSGEIAKEPTCTEEGVRVQTCSVCEETRNVSVAALGHSPEGDYTVDELPDFGVPGSKSYHCTRCGERLNSVEIPALDANTEIEYEFRVLRNNGDRINDSSIKIEIYDASGNIKAASTRSTLQNGTFKVNLLPQTYTVKVSNLPEGYAAETEYTVIPQNAICELWLTAAPIQKEIPQGKLYKVGDVMYDFTVTTVKNETITLSELLKTKKLVLINFFYADCPNCNDEFPELQKAYELYKDDVAVIAIDPYVAVGDSMQRVISKAAEFGLTFYVVWDNNILNLQVNFGVSGYPVSILIDQEGVIAWTLTGGYTVTNGFVNLFKQYTADSYWKNPAKKTLATAAAFEFEVVLPDKRAY